MSVVGKAIIELFPTEHGGLKAPLPSGTRSLLVGFTDSEKGETFGAVFTDADDQELAPGSTHTVTLSFWSDAAEIYGTRGAKLTLQYGREVGRGEIVEAVSSTPR